MKSELPKTIRIGPHDITISRRADVDDRNFGTWSENEMLIRLDQTFHAPSREVEVVLHEIEHAVRDIYVAKEKDPEERHTTTVMRGWTQVWRDNPDLLRWVMDSLHGTSE